MGGTERIEGEETQYNEVGVAKLSRIKFLALRHSYPSSVVVIVLGAHAK